MIDRRQQQLPGRSSKAKDPLPVAAPIALDHRCNGQRQILEPPRPRQRSRAAVAQRQWPSPEVRHVPLCSRELLPRRLPRRLRRTEVRHSLPFRHR